MRKNKANGHKKKLLTHVELELMTILWRIGGGSVSQVMAELPENRDLAYTSVSTILRILEQKKVLKTRKERRSHIYIPLLDKTDYEAKTVRHVVDSVFEGTPTTLIKRLLDTVSIDAKELKKIKELIEKKGKDK